MKPLLLSIFFVLSSFFVNAQTYYKAVLTELYKYNTSTENWDLYQKNSDVNITIVVEKDYINIQALSPSFFKVFDNSKEFIDNKNFTGYRYLAKDLKKETIIKMDVLKSLNTEYSLLSVIDNENGYNLRYFLLKVE